ncbi:hypothetical protein KSP40_PGU005113 [Platanthera guangdongensis]|uniref:Uncharacterized protein n=1 Tax=Platanthera guangdongensis TaxID=2320717 RepID=A0ABR2MGX9_9ASPA
MTSFIMQKHTERLSFTKASLKMFEIINEFEQFILKCRKDYLHIQVNVFVKAWKEHIDILKNRIYDKEKNENATIWLPVLSDGFYAYEIAYKDGVV